VGFDMAVCVDLLGIKVRHDLDCALAENVALEDIREGGLWIHTENQHLLTLLGQVVGGCGTEGGFTQTALSSEHDIAALEVALEDVCEGQYRLLLKNKEQKTKNKGFRPFVRCSLFSVLRPARPPDPSRATCGASMSRSAGRHRAVAATSSRVAGS